jgi:hypothetical protein
MAKSKGGPTFFEVLRTTNNSSKPAAGRALENARPEEPLIKPEPLDVAKELNVKPVIRAVEPEPVHVPAPAPTTPIIRHVEETFEPDKGSFQVSYSVGAFALLIAIVGMLGAFWFGVKQGRSLSAPAPAPVAQKPAADVTPPPPAAVQQWYTIKLYSWGFVNEQEKSTVRKIAEQHQQALMKKGFQAQLAFTSKEIVLVYGKFRNRTESKNVLDALRRVQYNDRPYYEKADFVPAE